MGHPPPVGRSLSGSTSTHVALSYILLHPHPYMALAYTRVLIFALMGLYVSNTYVLHTAHSPTL